MLEVKKDFSRRELLWFGPLFALFVALIGAALIRKLQIHTVVYGVWIASGLLIAVYYAIPSIRLSVYRGWIYAVLPIGWVVSHVALLVMYYLIITPVGLAMRAFGYDPMKRHLDRGATSYWIRRSTKIDPQSYFRQF